MTVELIVGPVDAFVKELLTRFRCDSLTFFHGLEREQFQEFYIELETFINRLEEDSEAFKCLQLLLPSIEPKNFKIMFSDKAKIVGLWKKLNDMSCQQFVELSSSQSVEPAEAFEAKPVKKRRVSSTSSKSRSKSPDPFELVNDSQFTSKKLPKKRLTQGYLTNLFLSDRAGLIKELQQKVVRDVAELIDVNLKPEKIRTTFVEEDEHACKWNIDCPLAKCDSQIAMTIVKSGGTKRNRMKLHTSNFRRHIRNHEAYFNMKDDSEEAIETLYWKPEFNDEDDS